MSLKTSLAGLALGILFVARVLAGFSLTNSPDAAFVLCHGTNVAPIYAETTENPAVTRALGDLADDVARVTGVKPPLANTGKTLVLVGTLGTSKLIDQFAASGKLDVSGVRGQWESYVLQIVTNPAPGVDRALVIAGSDPRGTIYGIYHLSETIGISPWYWWADVPVKTNKLVALHGDLFKQGPPAVKYRGIFINDEDWGLRPWAAKTFDTNTANIGPKTYEKVFELLLRLRANYLWPAERDGTAAFDSFPANRELAERHGIVISSARQESSPLWRDDNYGYLHPFPDPTRGAGVYYHLSYLGRPADYLWLCTTPPALIAEEMCKAYAYGADRVWVVNVGDIKPAEVATEFFLRLAWNPRAWNGTNINELLAPQFARDFGSAHAAEIAGIMSDYYRLNFPCKPEHLLLKTNDLAIARPPYSLSLNGDEAGRRLPEWQALTRRLTTLEAKLPPNLEDAIFELVGYGVYSSALAGERAGAMKQFHMMFAQGRAAAIEYRSLAVMANDTINSITANYNARAATNGKWMHLFDANPNGKPFHVPTNASILVGSKPILGLVAEGSDAAARADRTNNPALHLPRFNRLTQRSRFVDLFSATTTRTDWRATPDARWIRLDRTNGSGDARLQVSIDWTNAPAGTNLHGNIRFICGTNQELSVAVSAWNPADLAAARAADFVEDNFQVAMEAEHASAILPGKTARWQPLTGLGYNGQAMTIAPVTAPAVTELNQFAAVSPCLQYKLWLQTPGDWTVTVRALPTFSVQPGQPQRYAIAIDDAPPQIVSLPAATSENDPVWQQNVLRNAALTTSQHTLAQAGPHTLKVWMVDPGIVLDTIFATTTGAADLGYLGPQETRPVR